METLIERLQKRAKDDRDFAINSQVMFDLLKPQLDAFDAREGFNTYVVRAAVDHRNALRRDTQYADDLDAAIAALSVQKQLVEALAEMERVYEHGDFETEFKPTLKKARAAILAAKASS